MCYVALFIGVNMRGSLKFCQRGSNLFSSFCVFKLIRELGITNVKYPNSIKSGPSSSRQRNIILMGVDDDPTLNAGFVAL